MYYAQSSRQNYEKHFSTPFEFGDQLRVAMCHKELHVVKQGNNSSMYHKLLEATYVFLMLFLAIIVAAKMR